VGKKVMSLVDSN